MESPRSSSEPRRVLPVIAERLRVGRRRVTVGRVRITKKTRYRDVVVNEPVAREEVHVRRVPVGRFVEGPVADRYVNGRLIVSILEEVPVVVKRLRVVEELHIERRRQTVRRPQRVAVGREDPTIEREPALPEPRNRENHRPGRRYGGRNA
jgi:stress response protein YsnF